MNSWPNYYMILKAIRQTQKDNEAWIPKIHPDDDRVRLKIEMTQWARLDRGRYNWERLYTYVSQTCKEKNIRLIPLQVILSYLGCGDITTIWRLSARGALPAIQTALRPFSYEEPGYADSSYRPVHQARHYIHARDLAAHIMANSRIPDPSEPTSKRKSRIPRGNRWQPKLKHERLTLAESTWITDRFRTLEETASSILTDVTDNDHLMQDDEPYQEIYNALEGLHAQIQAIQEKWSRELTEEVRPEQKRYS